QGTRAGDNAAIVALAKLFDPNVMASDRSLDDAKTYGGLPQQLQELVNKPMGESGFTNDVRRQIMDLAVAEMQTRDRSMFQALDRARGYAEAQKAAGMDVNPAAIGAKYSTLATTIDQPEAAYAPEGVRFVKPLVPTLSDPNDPNSRLTFVREPGLV